MGEMMQVSESGQPHPALAIASAFSPVARQFLQTQMLGAQQAREKKLFDAKLKVQQMELADKQARDAAQTQLISEYLRDKASLIPGMQKQMQQEEAFRATGQAGPPPAITTDTDIHQGLLGPGSQVPQSEQLNIADMIARMRGARTVGRSPLEIQQLRDQKKWEWENKPMTGASWGVMEWDPDVNMFRQEDLRSPGSYKYTKPQTGMEITTADGTTVKTGVPTSGLQKKVVAGLEQKYIDSKAMEQDLQVIADTFNRHKDLLTYQGAARAWTAKKLNKFKISEDKIQELYEQTGGTGSVRDFVDAKDDLNMQVMTAFNKYRKWVTGAQATMREIEFLKQAMISGEESPWSFETKMKRYFRMMRKAANISRAMAEQGIPFSEEAGSEWGAVMDARMRQFNQEDIELRGQQLLREHPEWKNDMGKLYSRLEQEGYRAMSLALPPGNPELPPMEVQ